MMSKFSSHIKQESLRNIVLQESDCDTKLNQIRDLVGLPPISEEEKESEAQAVEENVNTVVDLKAESINRILEGLDGKELNLARNLLVDLEKAGLDWDPQSLELKVNGNPIEHSNLSLLVKKLVRASSPTLPIALVSFIDQIIKFKIPLTYIRDSDSQNIREALLKIKSNSTDNKVVSQGAEIGEEVGTLGSDEQEGGQGVDAEEDISLNSKNLKRKRDPESETEDLFGGDSVVEPKKRKVKKPFIGERRRSSRLKSNLVGDWSEVGK